MNKAQVVQPDTSGGVKQRFWEKLNLPISQLFPKPQGLAQEFSDTRAVLKIAPKAGNDSSLFQQQNDSKIPFGEKTIKMVIAEKRIQTLGNIAFRLYVELASFDRKMSFAEIEENPVRVIKTVADNIQDLLVSEGISEREEEISNLRNFVAYVMRIKYRDKESVVGALKCFEVLKPAVSERIAFEIVLLHVKQKRGRGAKLQDIIAIVEKSTGIETAAAVDFVHFIIDTLTHLKKF